VVVTGIEAGGMAAEQGLREDDVIVSVDQEQVASPDDVKKFAKRAADQNKDALPLLLNRGSRQVFLRSDVG
jgi:S1-C subfamily serine protease